MTKRKYLVNGAIVEGDMTTLEEATNHASADSKERLAKAQTLEDAGQLIVLKDVSVHLGGGAQHTCKVALLLATTPQAQLLD